MSHDNEAVVRHAYAIWGAGDYHALLKFFLDSTASDVELHSRFGGLAGEPYRGHDGVRAWLAEVQESFERFEPWLEEVRPAGDDRIVVLGGISFRARESGLDMDERMGWIQEFREGLLRRMLFYGSHGEALEAAGLSGQA
jgi:ketosteroid isomerase-like protein